MWLAALLGVALGVAIQRGTVCAVLAVQEWLRHGRADRFIGFFECGLWAALTLALLGARMSEAAPRAAGAAMVVGAALFGIGAVVNGACAFGTIGRLGNGRVEYLMTFAGVWLGIVVVSRVPFARMPDSGGASLEGLHDGVAIALLAGLLGWRQLVHRRGVRAFLALTVTMAALGALGAALSVRLDVWPWMNALVRPTEIDAAAATALVGLVAGAIAHGVHARRFRLERPTPAALCSRGVGGLLMGAGAWLVPGGNDALVLRGIPHGDLRALIGYLVMLAAIALTLAASGRTVPRWRGRAGARSP